MMFGRSRLGARFIVLLLLVFIIGSVGAGLVLSSAVEKTAERMIETQGLIILQTMNSVRSYTTSHVGPLLVEQQATSDQFIKERVPAFSAKAVFSNFQTQPDYQGFVYKEASVNPSNPSNLADDFEAGLLRQFAEKPGDPQVVGFTKRNDQSVFYIARPMRMPDDSCLQCHGRPEDAPQALLAQYGTINGFEWPRDSVIAAQVVYVPANLVAEQRRQVWIAVMIVLAGGFAVTGMAISLLLRRNVIQPVERMAAMAARIATADVQESEPKVLDGDARRPDELGQLARVFQKMAAEVYAREQRLRQQVQELKISVDESRKAREVAEITETEYFQELQRKAQTLWQRPAGPGANKDGDGKATGAAG